MEGGGLQNGIGGGGGHVKYYSNEKVGGGDGKSFSYAEGGAQKGLG